MKFDGELDKTFVTSEIFDSHKEFDMEKFKEKFDGFSAFMMIYNSAIREVKTKFEVLSDDFSVTYQRNPIEMIKSRVKKPMSIFDKLKRKNLPFSPEAIAENLNDVAGVRVICSYINDIYMIADMFIGQDDITLIESKDYIKNPKPNGYRSYHMIVEVPVFFANRKQDVRVEVQLRTIAMDFWASLEHQMRYKKSLGDISKLEIELAKCAETIAMTDLKMQSIHEKISGTKVCKKHIK